MNKKKLPGFLLFLICLTALLPAWGNRENDTVQEKKPLPVRVTGRVRLVGNEPFPVLVITGHDMQWYINEADVSKLKDLQHRTVTVEGIETVEQLTYANGLPAGERHTLSKIKIISVN